MHATNGPNSHGTSFDNWGNQFATDGTGGRAFHVRPSGNGFKMTELLKKEVRPVTAGERIVSITFIESMIANQQQRALVYQLNEIAALEGLKMSWDGRVRLDVVRQNLIRMWATP